VFINNKIIMKLYSDGPQNL